MLCVSNIGNDPFHFSVSQPQPGSAADLCGDSNRDGDLPGPQSDDRDVREENVTQFCASSSHCDNSHE